jgi:ribosome biogenesis GTPase A
VEQLRENMRLIEKVIKSVNKQEYNTLYDFLSERIDYPESFVTMLGETSSGKTSLINGLLGKNVLYTGPQPTTGSVVEVMDDPSIQKPEYFVVTKDAKLAPLSLDQFNQFCKELPDQFDRVRMLLPSFPKGLHGLRLFDTPGYGSIHEKHEEILKSFLPNSDILLYVVNYRVGVNQSDAEFIALIEELLRDDMKFYLIINRAPEKVTESDRRVKEIVSHVQDLLHKEVPVFIVPGVIPTDEEEPALPQADELWQHVKQELLSDERHAALERAFLGFQRSLVLDMQGYLEKKKLDKLASHEERQMLEAALKEFLEKKPVVEEKIITTFEKVTKMTKKMFSASANTMVGRIESEIQSSNKWTNQQECAGFVEAHLMPILAKKETKNAQSYIGMELDRLNEEIESMLNTAVQKFERRISIENKSFEKLMKNVSNRLTQRFADQALQAFFRQYGGAGGAGAGVANAAKKALKNLGDLVGKTFSRETHNGLAKFLSRMGATSTRAIAAAAVVIVEAAFYLYEVHVWQGKLSKQVRKAITVWEEKSITAVEADLSDSKNHNLEQVAGFFTEYEKAFSLDEFEEQEGNQTKIEEQLADLESLLAQWSIEEVGV